MQAAAQGQQVGFRDGLVGFAPLCGNQVSAGKGKSSIGSALA